MDSILTSIKKSLGIEAEYKGFDSDIISGINSALMALNQLGVGPVEGFVVSDDTATWDLLIGTAKNLEGIKSYIYLKTRLLFDPPGSSFVLQSISNQIAELEFRLAVQVEPIPIPEPDPIPDEL
jgi:hypothetical protein